MSRRNALSRLAITPMVISLPFVWIKPIVKTVIIPSHAATSTRIDDISTLVGDWNAFFNDGARFQFSIRNSGAVAVRGRFGSVVNGAFLIVDKECTGSITGFVRVSGTVAPLDVDTNGCGVWLSGNFNQSEDRITGQLVRSAFAKPEDLFTAQRI